jgi:hypothetical protein
VCVYATQGVGLRDVEKTIDTINEVVKEFNLPLQIVNGNESKSDDTRLVENLITGHTQENSIDCESALEELRRYWNEVVLGFALVVLVPERYEFKKEPSDSEPAIYDGHSQSLAVLRRFDIQNAVRHEFGHMIGLGIHHKDCAMDWNCSVHNFCEDCLKEIEEVWEL